MMEKIPTQTGTREQLMSDLKTVIQDAEAWLRNGGQLTGDELKAAKAKFEQTLSAAKEGLSEYQQTVVEKTKEAARVTDEYVHENPWKSVGLGAAVGVVIGMLIARR
ncbi:MAG: YqjD family protein [Pseudomonadota bacterium]